MTSRHHESPRSLILPVGLLTLIILLLTSCGTVPQPSQETFATPEVRGKDMGGITVSGGASTLVSGTLFHAVWLRPTATMENGVILLDISMVSEEEPAPVPVRLRRWMSPSTLPVSFFVQDINLRDFEVSLAHDVNRILSISVRRTDLEVF